MLVFNDPERARIAQEIIDRTPEFDSAAERSNARQVYQRGYKAGLAQALGLQLDRLYSLAHRDYLALSRMYEEETGQPQPYINTQITSPKS